jgi:hypothetical protein
LQDDATGNPTTRTVNESVAVFPAASVAVHVTVVAPIGNVDPDAGEQETRGLGSTSSRAETV